MEKKKAKVAKKIARVPTGIPGLDNMLEGGLPAGSITLLSGACGTGKSTLAMQFLYSGAKYMDEPGVYVTLEEDPKKLVENMSLFGWELEELIAKKKLLVIKPEVYKFESIKQIISDAIEKIHAKRLVVDSYSVLLTYFSDPYEIRNGLVQLDREIKKMDCTALVISDIKDNSEIFSTTGVEEFIVDGVIVLYLIKSHTHPFEFERAMSVRKMRATNHPLKTYPFRIGGGGIEIGSKHIAGPLHGTRAASATTIEPPIKKEKKKEKAAQKKEEAIKKKDAMIALSALKTARKEGHSWKWKHL
ncbi:MAG: AAA family ATPase [Candidatus Micrarchaeota archaeon]|nr:AAA family ATPase [Candidatus Micrarchaeota archaeon]